jgi:alkanesulfonate monooxygenase SsuD/methylene tetrahydromethanopterin reductase-like flavin-dependent oxidoreductase (luciferase family)
VTGLGAGEAEWGATGDPHPERIPLVGVMLLPLATPFGRLERTARLADELGYDALWMFDHLEKPHSADGDPAFDVYEGWTTATILAIRTERIHVGHNVLCDSFRHPAVLAKMAVTLDVATGGRFELGIGWGSMPDELRRFGVSTDPPARRAARLRETLEILELMFGGDRFSYTGEFFVLRDAIGLPRPVNGRIPLQIGGSGPRLTLPLVARYADWWNCPSNVIDRLPELRPQVGSAKVAVQCVMGLAESSAQRDEVAEQVHNRFPDWGASFSGTPDEITPSLRALVEQGVDQLVIQFHDFAKESTLHLFASEVLPALRAA